MSLRRRLAFAGCVLLAACDDPSGPKLEGRWAAEGLELETSTLGTELRMPCLAIPRMPPLRIDSGGHFELSGIGFPTFPPYGSLRLTLRGQFLRDTIDADLTIVAREAPAHTTHYKLVRGGNPAFDRFGCLAA